MKKELNLKNFFYCLECLPEVKQQGKLKTVRQLRSYYNNLEKDYPFVDVSLFSRITRTVTSLQDTVSDNHIIQILRKIQSKCDKKKAAQQWEKADCLRSGSIDSYHWLGSEFLD